MLDTSLMHHMNTTCEMEKCEIVLIGCFNDAFCIPQSYSGLYFILMEAPLASIGYESSW